MKPSQKYFSPETIDEQIEQLSNNGVSTSNVTHAQDVVETELVHALRTMSQHDAHGLANVRERLAAAYEESDGGVGAIRKPIAWSQPMPDPLSQPTQLQAFAQQRKKQPTKQRMVQLLSGLVAVLIIGSVLAVFLTNGVKTSHPGTVTPSDYYSLSDGKLIRVDASSGAIRWKYTLNQTTMLGPSFPFVIQGDTVYAVDNTTEYAINNTNGTLRWSKHYASNVQTSSLIIANNRFYAIDKNNQQIDAFTLADGKPAQTYSIPLNDGDNLSSFIIANNVLYAWSNAKLVAIELDNKQTLWTKSLPVVDHTTNEFVSAHVDDGTLYIMRSTRNQINEEQIFAFNVKTGVQIGQTPLMASGIPPFTAINNIVYPGVQIGQTPLMPLSIPPFTTINNIVYYSTDVKNASTDNNYENTLHAYDIKTGKQIWQKDIDGIIAGVTSMDGKAVNIEVFPLISSPFIKIITLDAQSGAQKWQYSQQIQKPNDSQEYNIVETPSQPGQGLTAIYINILLNQTSMVTDIITPDGKAIQLKYHN